MMNILNNIMQSCIRRCDSSCFHYSPPTMSHHCLYCCLGPAFPWDWRPSKTCTSCPSSSYWPSPTTSSPSSGSQSPACPSHRRVSHWSPVPPVSPPSYNNNNNDSLSNLLDSYWCGLLVHLHNKLLPVTVYLVYYIAIAVIGLNGFPWEQLLNAGQYLVEFLALDVFPDIEEDIGELLLYLVLGHLGPAGVIIFIPFIVL